MAQTTTAFTTPGYDYGVELGQIERRRALAEAMQKSSFQPIEQQTAGGWVIPNSPIQGAAKLAQALASKRSEQKADQQQRDLNKKVQGDYQAMLARGLSQLRGTQAKTIQPDPQEAQQAADYGTPEVAAKTIPAQAPDPIGALQTFGSHPMGQQFAPLVMQELSRQRLAEALRGGQAPTAGPQPSPMDPSNPNPSVMAGSGSVPMQSAPQQPQPPRTGGPAGGIPMEAWLETDPSGKSYLQHLASQGESSGRVFYDQSGKAFTVGKNGAAMYLPGITARDKPEAVNLGGETRFINPFAAGGQQFAHTPTIGNQLEGTRLYYETGMNPLAGAGQQPATPQGVPQPAPHASPQPAPRPSPVQAPPGQVVLTPKQKQEIEAQRPDAVRSITTAMNTLQNSINEAERLSRNPGLSHITGPIAGRTPNLTGTATNAQANLDTLKSQIGVDVLNAMREASKTGGAVGNVTEKEWPILQNQLGALQQSQTTDEFKRNLGVVKGTLARMQGAARKAHESRFGALNWNPAVPESNIVPGQNDPLGLRGGP